jgi:hypothetical protein
MPHCDPLQNIVHGFGSLTYLFPVCKTSHMVYRNFCNECCHDGSHNSPVFIAYWRDDISEQTVRKDLSIQTRAYNYFARSLLNPCAKTLILLFMSLLWYKGSLTKVAQSIKCEGDVDACCWYQETKEECGRNLILLDISSWAILLYATWGILVTPVRDSPIKMICVWDHRQLPVLASSVSWILGLFCLSSIFHFCFLSCAITYQEKYCATRWGYILWANLIYGNWYVQTLTFKAWSPNHMKQGGKTTNLARQMYETIADQKDERVPDSGGRQPSREFGTSHPSHRLASPH